AGALAAHAAHQVLYLLSWWVLGEAIQQQPAGLAGWLGAWLLLLATMIPLHALEIRCQLAFTLRAGAALHRRLLAGALRPNSPAGALRSNPPALASGASSPSSPGPPRAYDS